jgi:hypothetical protein
MRKMLRLSLDHVKPTAEAVQAGGELDYFLLCACQPVTASGTASVEEK